jgi:hypothetical protein
MESVDILGHLVYFMAIRKIFRLFGTYILWPFGIFSTVLVYCSEKNLATLLNMCTRPWDTAAFQKSVLDRGLPTYMFLPFYLSFKPSA